MSAPQRRRPGANSPISLAPKVEPVNTGAPPAQEGNEQPAPVSVHEQDQERRTTPVRPGSTSLPPTDDSTVATTTLLRRSLKLQAQTAVLRTQQEPTGYRSFAALVNGAIERELDRLANEYNGGAPFEQNPGPFRTGRPFGG